MRRNSGKKAYREKMDTKKRVLSREQRVVHEDEAREGFRRLLEKRKVYIVRLDGTRKQGIVIPFYP